MSLPRPPWYGPLERALAPARPYSQALLVAVALGALYIAWAGSDVARFAALVWIVSP